MEKDVHLIALFILVIPLTLCTVESVFVLDGYDARIPCDLENVSPLENHVVWTLPPTIDNARILKENKGHQLVIQRVSREFNGLYKCQVGHYANSINVLVARSVSPLFQGLRVGLPIAECNADRLAEYQLGVGRAFCGQPVEDSCWAQISYIGCFNDELYKVEIRPRIAEGTILNADGNLSGLLGQIKSQLSGHYDQSKQSLVTFLKHSDFPVDVSQYAVYPKWYIDFYFGGSVYERVREEVAQRIVSALPPVEVAAREVDRPCELGYGDHDSPVLCLPCQPGEFGRHSSCFPCTSGTFQDLYAQPHCKPCNGIVSPARTQCTHVRLNQGDSSTSTVATTTITTKRPSTTIKNTIASTKAEASTTPTANLETSSQSTQNTTQYLVRGKAGPTRTQIESNRIAQGANEIPPRENSRDDPNLTQSLSRPAAKGAYTDLFLNRENNRDPMGYILVGVLIPFILAFIVLCIIKVRRREDKNKDYRRILRGEDIDSGKKKPRLPDIAELQGIPTLKKDGDWADMLRQLQLGNLYAVATEEEEENLRTGGRSEWARSVGSTSELDSTILHIDSSPLPQRHH